MKVNINGQDMDVDILEVGKRYKHLTSDTLWRIHSMTSGLQNTIDVELVNRYGDVMDRELLVSITPIMARVGTFVEISKEEFESRKNR